MTHLRRIAPPLVVAAAVLGIALGLAWATAVPLHAARAGTPSFDQLLALATAALAWTALGHLVLVLAATALAALPGAVGRGAATVAETVTPAAGRRLARLAVGLTVAAGQNIGEYRVDQVNEASIAFTYLPLKTKQTMELQ